MKLLRIVFLMAVFAGVSAQAGGIPSLVGTWTGEYGLGTPSGVHKTAVVVKIAWQDGAVFGGTKTWKRLDGSMGVNNGVKVSTQTEKILGVIDFDNKSVHIVEGPEEGRYVGTIAGKNLLSLIFTDSGEEVRATRMKLTREVK